MRTPHARDDMIPVQRIAHATYETPDLARQIDYYTQVIGLNLAGALLYWRGDVRRRKVG